MTEQIEGVLIGAGLAFIGVIVAQIRAFIMDLRQREEQRRIYRRQKYEEFCDVFTEALGWMVHFHGAKTSQELWSLEPHHAMRRLITLSILYFPALKKLTIEFVNGCGAYHSWALIHFVENGTSIGEQIVKVPDFEAQMKLLFAQKNCLEEAIQENAPKYVNA